MSNIPSQHFKVKKRQKKFGAHCAMFLYCFANISMVLQIKSIKVGVILTNVYQTMKYNKKRSTCEHV